METKIYSPLGPAKGFYETQEEAFRVTGLFPGHFHLLERVHVLQEEELEELRKPWPSLVLEEWK